MTRREVWRLVAIGVLITLIILVTVFFFVAPTPSGNPFGVNQ